MARVPVTDKSFVMAPSGAQGTRPTRPAIVLAIDMTSREKVRSLLRVHTLRDISQRMSVGIDETMAWSDVAGWPDSQQAQAGSAWMGFVHALIELGQRVADIGEAVQLAAQSVLEIFVGEDMKLIQHSVHSRLIDRVEAIG